jgi:hypothetical protein
MASSLDKYLSQNPQLSANPERSNLNSGARGKADSEDDDDDDDDKFERPIMPANVSGTN